MRISFKKLFKRKKIVEKCDYEVEQCRKIAMIEAFKQREYVRHNSNICMRFQSWNMYDISMK